MGAESLYRAFCITEARHACLRGRTVKCLLVGTAMALEKRISLKRTEVVTLEGGISERERVLSEAVVERKRSFSGSTI